MRPNVLLIVLDTARADVFEPYGAPVKPIHRRGVEELVVFADDPLEQHPTPIDAATDARHDEQMRPLGYL